MKTNIVWDADDETRARIRAFYGRSGHATRQEIRRFVADELEQSVKELPEAKRRGCNSARRKATAVAAAPPANAADVCKRCGELRGDHQRGRFCKVSRTIPPGSTFLLLDSISEARS